MKKENIQIKIFIGVTAVFLGLFISMQSRSFEQANEILIRDNQSNVFQEIQIIKNKNQNLADEISELKNTLEQLDDRNFALEALEKQIMKYEKLAGHSPVFGPGIVVEIDGKITTAWVIDLVNEFFNSGAEAVSVNGIRLTNQTVGFDTLPQGQILLNGSILSAPYVFSVLGESEVLAKVLELPGGIFLRMQAAFPEAKISKEKREIIQIN